MLEVAAALLLALSQDGTGRDAIRRERRAESAKRLEAARKAVGEERRAEAARQKAVIERLRDRTLTLKLKDGMTLERVTVLALARDEIRASFPYEGGHVEQSLPVEFIDDRSYVALMKAVYADDGAAGFYEMGRAFVFRKLWKDAQAAFAGCVKQDPSFQERVPDLARILNNEGAFQGTARRIGADQLLLGYDFADPAQARDFVLRQPGTLAIEEGALKLSSTKPALWSLSDVDFERDLEVELVALFDASASLMVGAFIGPERTGSLAFVNGRAPGGHVVCRLEPGKPPQPLAGQADPPIAAGAEARIRFQARGGAFRLFVGDRLAAEAWDDAPQRGWLTLGVTGGAVRIRKLSVQGRASPADLDKRFAEAEILARRALEPDLGRVRSEDAAGPLSAEDDAAFAGVEPSVRSEYEGARAALAEAMQSRRLTQELAESMDAILRKAPDLAPARYWRGRILLLVRRAEEAREEFEKAVRIDPGFHEAHFQLGRLRLEDLDPAGAAAAAKRALELAPGEAEPLALAAYLRFVTAGGDGGAEDLEIARKLDPSSEYAFQMQKIARNVQRGPRHLGARWTREFPHFTVMTDLSAEKTALYGARLEAAHRHFAEVFKDAYVEDPKRPKPRVAIFNTREAYLTYGELTLTGRQEWTLGYFHPLHRELILYEDRDADATLQTLYHEAFHYFMSLLVTRVPYWYGEGLAEYMGALRVEAPKHGRAKVVERARVQEGRLKRLRAGLPHALRFRELMMESPSKFYSGPVSLKYAQAWSMVHFFHEASGGKHKPRLDAYFQALRKGATAGEALEAGFGGGPMDDLEREWLEYVKTLELPKK